MKKLKKLLILCMAGIMLTMSGCGESDEYDDYDEYEDEGLFDWFFDIFEDEGDYDDDDYYEDEREYSQYGHQGSQYGHQGSQNNGSSNGHQGAQSGNSSAGESSIAQPVSADISQYFADGAIREKQVIPKGNGEDTVTMLVFMNGSNLESESGEATEDLSEMVAAGSSDKVNVVVQTMGTKKWDKKYGIASNRSQRYRIDGKGLTLVQDNLGQLDCTDGKTLSDFIIWGVQNYPADRYILHFWDHGGGPVYGFGYDEWNKDEDAALTIAEMQQALKTAGVYFDFVGMDCCLMSCLEVCCAFYDYCDYMVLSEDFESGLGWAYTDWMKALYNNTSINTLELGKMICDTMVEANEKSKDGDKSSMTVIDQAMLKVLYAAWTDFAYANERQLLGTNYSRSRKRPRGGRILPVIPESDRSVSRPNNHGGKPFGWNYFFGLDDDEENLDMAEYFVTDIMEVASAVDSEQSAALTAAINATLCYVRNTKDNEGLTGIAVSLPYGDRDYYTTLKPIFYDIGLDAEYVDWLYQFTSVEKQVSESLHDSWDDSWDGWDEYEDDYDWESSEYSDYDDEYWDDRYDWDDFEYEDSWNEWSCEHDWERDDWRRDDDWHYDRWERDDYRRDDDWSHERWFWDGWR